MITKEQKKSKTPGPHYLLNMRVKPETILQNYTMSETPNEEETQVSSRQEMIKNMRSTKSKAENLHDL